MSQIAVTNNNINSSYKCWESSAPQGTGERITQELNAAWDILQDTRAVLDAPVPEYGFDETIY